MERRIAVRGIIFDDKNRLFAVKHKTREGGESDYWATPGGGLDVGESLQAGLERELIEEFGVKPVVGKLLFTQQFLFTRHNGEVRESMEFLFHIENFEDYNDAIDLSKTSHGAKELARIAYIDPTAEDLLPTFLTKVNIREQIDNDSGVYMVNNLNETSR
jgi:8-oxo-dGTP pyrophosphatase MutT (NUDIX family)